MSGRRRGMIDATPKVRSMKPCCLRSRVGSSYERVLLGRSSGQPCEAWSSCECSRRPNLLTTTTTLMVAWMGAGAASRGIRGACCRDEMQQVFSIDRRKWSYMKAINPWLLQPSMDSCNGGCRRADGRAECGKRGTSWGPSRNRFRKSATAVASVTDVPSRLPSSIFDFVLGTSPSWSLKVWALHGRTPYGNC